SVTVNEQKPEGSQPSQVPPPSILEPPGSVPEAPAAKEPKSQHSTQPVSQTVAETPPAQAEAKAAVAPPEDRPPGAKSVYAAGQPQYVPVPIVTVPPTQAYGPPPQAPQPNRGLYQPVNPGWPAPPRGAANAFT